jgi:hypothetical protein
MEKIVASIQQATTEAELKSLKSYLAKEDETIKRNVAILDDALAVLDPAAYSLGYAFLL